jgi:hypothetical protein
MLMVPKEFASLLTTVAPPVHNAGVAACPSLAGGGHPGARQADCHRCIASHGAGAREIIATVSSRLEPRRLVQPRGIAAARAAARAHSPPHGSIGYGVGRYHRAPPRGNDPGPRDLPRSGALLSPPCGQGQRVALAKPDAAGPPSRGQARLGLALFDGAGSF